MRSGKETLCPCDCTCAASPWAVQPRIGAVLCTIFSIAIVITFLILVAAILMMPTGDSLPRKEPLINTSVVVHNASDTNSTGSGTPPPSGDKAGKTTEEGDEKITEEPEITGVGV
ncbi:uncharacterized protein LOC144108112 [Amblyomma americanum]